jgi:hypothetical protein
LTCDVEALRPLLQCGAHDQIVDFGGLDPRALYRFLNYRSGHRRRLGAIKSAAVGFTDRRPGCRYDDRFSHVFTP